MGRANAGLGQSEGGRWTAAARAGLRRSAATRQRLSTGTGRGIAADAGVSGTLARAAPSRPATAAKSAKSPSPTHKPKEDRKSTRLNSSHGYISYAVFCLKKKKKEHTA